MKPNVEFPKKVKNSFIFFQLGLIATMLVVLFALEFNFELKPKKNFTVEMTPQFTIQIPTDFRVIPESKPLVDKPLVAAPKFKNLFKATKNDVPEEKLTPVETAAPVEAVNSDKPVTDTPIKEVIPVKAVEPTMFNVEELPMFPACKGLDRNEQMKCFEEQMAKTVAKNTVYPKGDLEVGKQGRALISFVIDETGKIVDVKAINNKFATLEMQKAAELAVRKVSKLTPAKQGGKPVRVKYTIPFTFRVNN